MKSISYQSLSSLNNAEIESLMQSPEGFVVMASRNEKNNIMGFLENENRYLAGQRGLLDRLKYLWGGWRGFLIIPFVTVWNRALINGFVMDSVEEKETMYLLKFKRCNKN